MHSTPTLGSWLRQKGRGRKGKEMRNKEEIADRLAAVEAKLDEVAATIQRLALVVTRGDAGWMQALEVLASAYQRRNALRVQAENLRWVLTPMKQLAS
jgi:hypothetical protein